MSKEFDWDNWLQALDEIRYQTCDIVPEGFKNLDQLGEMFGNISQSQTRKNVLAMLAAGKVERTRFRICVDGGKSTRQVWHYKLKPSTNGKAAQTQTKAKAAR